MKTEKENPFPLHLLNEDQKAAYFEWKKLFAICHNPPPENLEIGTIVMPTGYWLDRAPKSLELFKERFNIQIDPPILVVSGKHSHPDLRRGGAGAMKVVRAFEIYGNLTDDMKLNLFPEDQSTNTKNQAENVYDLLRAQIIREPLVAIVSAEHFPRFYSTFVNTILNREKNLLTRLFSIAVFGDWMSEIPKEKRGKRWEQIPDEIRKINEYRKQGDVIKEEGLNHYVNWLRSLTNNG